tara:strand:+ start:333 stop:806 length:474 start_codon:yes stop_codon:yes gene_type:complete
MSRSPKYQKGDKVYIAVKTLSEFGLKKGLEGEVRQKRKDGKYLVDFGTTMQPVETKHIKPLENKEKENKDDLEIIKQPEVPIEMVVDEASLDAIGLTEDYIASLPDDKVSTTSSDVLEFIYANQLGYFEGTIVRCAITGDLEEAKVHLDKLIELKGK